MGGEARSERLRWMGPLHERNNPLRARNTQGDQMKRDWYVELASDAGEVGTVVRSSDPIAAEHTARLKIQRAIRADATLAPVGAHHWPATVSEID